MSYSISISGHKSVADQEEGRAFEESVVEKAKELVASLEGVSSATLSGANVGHVNLMLEAESAPETDQPAGAEEPYEGPM